MANPLPPPGGPPPPLPSSLPPAPPLPGSAAQSRSDSNVLSGIMNAPRPPGTTPGVAPLAPTSALPSVPLTAKAPAPLPQAPPGATQLPLQSRSDTNILSGIMGGSPPLPSSAPPLPPPASVPPPQVPTSGTSVSAQNRSDSSILSGIMGGSRPFAGTSVSAPLAPTSATALPPPASLPPSQATVPSSTAFDPPLPGGPRQKPPPIQTSLTPRPPAGSSSQDSAVLNTIIGKAPSTTMQSVPMPSGQASSFAPLASQSQSQASKDGAVLGALLGGSQALPSQTITSQASKDGAVLGSLMGSQPPSLAPLGNQNVTSQERRDGAVLGSLMASPPSPTFSPLASQQVRNKDAAVLGSLMGGRESRDDAILTQTMEGTFASQSAISQARMDGAVLGSLMGQGRESRDDAILMQTMQGLRSDPLGYVANQQSRDDAAIRQLVPEYDATDDAAMARLIGGPVEQLRRDDDALGALMQREYDEIASQAGAHSSPNRVGMRRRNAGVTNARNAALAKRLGRPHGAAMPRRTRVTGPRQGPTRDILEERAKVSMEQENATLRRAKLEMKSKVQELEVKLRRLKSTDGKEGIAKAREIDAMAEVESLAKALKLGAPQAQRSGPPAMHRGQRTQGPASAQPRQRHSSQPGQRRLGGRLQRRTEQKPWGPHDELQLPSPKAAGSWMQSNQPPVTLADSLRQSAQFRSASPPNRGPYPSSAPAMPQPFVSMPPRMQDSAHGYAPTSSPPLGPLVPANVTPPALAQDFPFFPLPEIKPLEMPSSPTTALPPLSMLDTGAISSPGVGEDEYTRRLREEEHALREQKHQLDEQLENLIVGRMGEYKIARNYKDRLKTKEGRIKNLERELEREQRKASQSRESLERAKNETQTHLTVARDRVHRMGAGLGVAEDVTPLQQQLQALKDANRLLTKDIRDLTVGAFCNSANQRVVTHQKIDEIERQKAEKEQDSEKLRADQARIEAECYQASLDVTALDDECRKLMEDNERWEIRIEEKEEAVRRAVDAYKGIMDNLEPEDRDVLNFSLQFLKDREARNNNQQLLERVVQGAARSPVPSDAASLTASRATLGGIGKQRSVEETTHVVESLRAQKAELAQEIVAIKAIIQREQAIEKDLKAMHTLDVDELGLQIQVTMEDTDRCKKLALDREKRIQEYRKELVKRQKLAVEQPGRPKPLGTYSERASDVISEAGFSGLTELDGVNNALDIYLTVGRVEERALLELPRRPNGDEVMDEAALVTMIFVEFLHFDVACSEEASTLKPRYDSLLSFGPFEVSDPVVEHFAKGAVRFELQAFAVGGTAAYTLGRAILPLAVMLDCTPQDRNPVVTGTLSFAAESDSRIQIASIQYKARWRTSLLEALSLYAARLGSTPAAIVEAQTAKVGPGAYAAPGLMGAMRTLIVQIRSVTGLQSFRQGVPPEALRPYVSYEVPGHLEHATEVMAGSMCPFQDTHKMSVRIDDDFCRWVNKHPQEGGGLHFVVFDSNVPAGQQPQVGVQSEDMLGVLGEVRIPIGTLLTSPYALVEGAYPLQRAAGFQTIAAGILDVHIRWQDEPSAVVATPGAGAATAFYGAGSSGAMTEEKFQIVWQRVMRRLYAMKLSASDWFNNNDLDKDGRWTKHEARMALSQMPIGLSPYECEQIFERMDSFRRGFVALSDIAGALAEGAKAAPLEQWARDIYRRMAEAMARQGQTAEQAFCAVARGWQAQKREFFALATSLDLGMKPEQLEWLWKLSDTNSDGLLDFREFAARLREVTGMATTAYTLPRPEKDMIDAPGGGSGPACEAGPMTDMRLELCLLGLLRCCQELGWRTVDRVMQEIGGRQGGGISRAVLMTFCLRARARISEWEVDQIVTRLDFDASGAIDERTLRAALFRCALSDAPCQVITRRAMLNIGRMRQGLMDRRLRFAPQVSAVVGIGGLSGASTAAEDLVLVFKSLLEEVVAQKAPLLVTRPEFQKIAQLLGVDRGQAELDELWAFVGKLRDGSLDTVAFMKQVTEMPLPGEGDVDWMSDERFAILMGRVKKALERLSLGGAAKAFDKFRTGSERCLSPLELEAAFTQVLDNLSPHERKLLVARIDANKDGKIDLVELEAALDHANVSALGDWAAGICKRVANSLRRRGKSIDDLFVSLAEGSPVVHWINFEKLFGQMEPSLTSRQLQQLWWAFDKNHDGGVSLDEFRRAFTILEEEAEPDAMTSKTDLLHSPSHRAVDVGTQHVFAAAQPTQAEVNVCARIVNALAGRGQTVDGLFNSLAKQGIVRFEDFVMVFANIEPSLTSQQLDNLWRTFDQDGSGGVCRDEFKRGLSLQRVPQQAFSAARPTQAEVEVCARIVKALKGSGQTVDGLFNSLAKQGIVYFNDFVNVFATMEPSLTNQQLDNLWRTFDQDGSGGVSRDEFQRGLSLRQVPTQTAAATRPTQAEVDVCARIVTALTGSGQTVDGLFNSLAKQGIVYFNDFVSVFAKIEPSLTGQQLDNLWRTFDQDGSGGVSRDEFQRGLSLQKVPMSRPTQAEVDVCARIVSALTGSGQTVDGLFDSLAKQGIVYFNDFVNVFVKIEPSLTNQQLDNLWRTFDQDGSGGVSRDEFQRGLSLQKVPMSRPTQAEVDVCARIVSALTGSGQTVDGLFNSLATQGIVYFNDFVSVFAKIEPSLTSQQLDNLWRTFDQDGSGGVSRDEFQRGLSLRQVPTQTAAATRPTQAEVDVCARIVTALTSSGQTVDGLFNSLAKQGIVYFNDFVSVFAKIEPSLTGQQLDNLWRTFDQDGSGGVSRDEFQRGLSLQKVPMSRPTQAEVDVCARIVSALTGSGQTVDGLFDSLAKQGIVYFNDFVNVFVKIEPSLTNQQLDNLWRTFDQDGSGGVSRDEFQRGLSLQKVPMSRPTQAEMDVCARIVTALTGSGQTIDGLFNSLAKQGIVYFNDFVDVFAKIEPSLTNQQLDNLWRTFDQDGSGGVSRDEFQRGLSLRKEVIHQATLPGVSSSSTAQDKEQNVCARIQAVLTREGKSVNDLFNGLANGGETVQLEPFLQMFAKMEPSLTREQLQHLWRSFDSDGSGGVSREEFRRVLNQQNLQPSSTSVLALGPKDVDKDICARVQKVLAEAGKSPDDLFDALAQGGASVRWEPFAEMFTKMESSMTPEQLKHLWQTFDKDGDNSVSREEFRRVLAPQAATGSLSAPTEESVLDRVKRVLQQEGKTADDLFVAMAAGGVAVQRAEFMTLFMDLEPGLTGGQLQHLWGSFDKNGDGMISREEFLRILDPPKAASVARLSGVTNDELIKLLQLIAASSTQREGTIQEQIRAFDVQKTGCLDRVAFDMAMRSYSPTIADDVLTALWAFLGGETADTSALNIEFLATKILSFSDPTMDRMVDIANKDKLVKLLQLMAVCSAQRDGTIQEQLRAFDLQKIGHLDRLAFDMAMRAYSPSIADNLLMDLWTFLGGEAAGALGLNVEYLAAKIMSFRDAAIDRTAEAVGKDKLMKLLQLMAVCSAQRGGTTEEQLRAFDFQKTGRLDRLAFDTAMRAYSPSIADSVLTDLWAFLGGQAAGGSALGVEDLAKTIASFHPTTGRPAMLGTPIVGAHGAIGEQAPDTRKSSHGAPCPLDLKPCTLQCLTNVANRLQHEGANGFIDFHKMHIILEANGINVARRTTNRLKPWMCETKDSLAYWPPLLAFCVCIDKITITADKPTRVAYPSLQCEISFCGEVVKLPPFNWSGCGMMPSEPKKISKTLKTHARFNIDGPYCISREDLVVALRPPPQVPPSHCVRVALVGSDMPLDASSSADGSFTYSLGSFELFMQRDLPQLDLREGSVRKIDWHLPGVPGKGPRLHAEISVSTQNVKRIWQKCGF